MILIDYFQCIPTNVGGSKKKEASDLDKLEAGKLAAFKKRVNLAQILETLEETCHSMSWQNMQCRKSGAFLTCKAAGCDSSCCHEQCGKGGIGTSQLPWSSCFLKTPSSIKITENCFKMVAGDLVGGKLGKMGKGI